MKKTIILFCSLFSLILLMGCASMATTKAARLYWAQPYEILVKSHENIEESWTNNIMPIYKEYNKLFATMNIVSIGKRKPSNERIYALKKAGYSFDAVYYFSVNYQGQDWQFIKNLNFKTDDRTVKLEDNNPKRHTITLSTVFCVEQSDFFLLNEDDIKSLLNTQSLSIQYTGSPIIKLPEEAIQKIKEFIKSEIITTPSKNW